MSTAQQRMALTGEPPKNLSTIQKVATGIGWTGLVHSGCFPFLTVALSEVFLWISLGLIAAGVIIFASDQYLGKPKGIKNDGVWFKSISSRGALAWGAGILLTLFYIVLYWYPEYLGPHTLRGSKHGDYCPF